jgi:hypothetical protein
VNPQEIARVTGVLFVITFIASPNLVEKGVLSEIRRSNLQPQTTSLGQ